MDTKSSIKIDIDNIDPSPFEILERKITDEFGDSYEIIYEIVGQYSNILQDNYANQKIITNDKGIFVSLGSRTDYIKEKVDQKYYDEAEKFKAQNSKLFEEANNHTFMFKDFSQKIHAIKTHVFFNYRMEKNSNELNDLFIKLLKSIAIPARKTFGYLRKDYSFNSYQWAEVAINDQWYSADSSLCIWSGGSPNHLKIKNENDFGNETFKFRVSKIISHASDFNIEFVKDFPSY